MQIDCHHAGTYVAARLAGFAHGEAQTIAYAAQYVDDATNDGTVEFSNSPFMYARTASAHRLIDPDNLLEIKNHLAWLPFHFLPGNDLLPAGETPSGGEQRQLTCCPDSPVARDMLRLALADRASPRALQRLGIAMHVYADTFSHQGFVGAMSPTNRISHVTSGDGMLDKRIRTATEHQLLHLLRRKARLAAGFVTGLFVVAWQRHQSPLTFAVDFFCHDPLGHAAAGSFPDLPFLSWQFRNAEGLLIHRDNRIIYLGALNLMVRAMAAWRAGDATMALERYPDMGASDASIVKKLLTSLTDPSGETRHAQWCEAIRAGLFSFGPADIHYAAKGEKSWKAAALGTNKEKDKPFETYRYSADFLHSHWKLFHDAAQAHRSDVVHDLLPRYGICAA